MPARVGSASRRWNGFAHGEPGNPERRQVEQFLLAFDTNHAPIVGQQATLTRTSLASVNARVDLMIARAEAGECDLVAKAGGGASARGYLYLNSGSYLADTKLVPPVPDALLRAIARLPGQETTFTCVPVEAEDASVSIAIATVYLTAISEAHHAGDGLP